MKAAKGNPGKRQTGEARVEQVPELASGAPKGLTKDGREIWSELAARLR